MNDKVAIVLAAGEGKRMKSDLSKVVHKVAGLPIIKRVCNAVKDSGIDRCVVVVGHKKEQVEDTMKDEVLYAVQKEQLGTGHAVIQAIPMIGDAKKVVVLCGDAPLISASTIKEALEQNEKNGESATILTACFENPTGYGRIIRNQNGDVSGIVEHKDATDEQKLVNEVNSSMYCFDRDALLSSISKINNKNAQNEYYLTDVIKIMISEGKKVGTYKVNDKNDIMGINDRMQLAEANKIIKKRVNEKHMKEGITIIDPENTYIEENVEIGRDTIVYPGTILEGNTKIGSNCIIGPNSKITDSVIEDGASINNSVLVESKVGKDTKVGPFAYLRPNSNIGNNVRIGDFVEIKNSNIGNGTKVSHLTYVGDSDIGEKVNFGCGTVTVNYDGVRKYRTVVGDNVFLGCNTNLVAPVKVGNGAYTAAGTTVTEDVPEDALAIGRVRQEIKEGWAKKKKEC
jgi:bifunctional UDP-N-acetylglucosamine pyrophosphorylase/glucosamine-1-phosphate N-acetyltransferase